MRCNLSKKRLLDTLVFDEQKIDDDVRFECYRVHENLVYKSALEDGYDSIQAAFMAGYYCGHVTTILTIRKRLSFYFNKLKRIEINRSWKRIKDIMG